jgi:hypothetical protein
VADADAGGDEDLGGGIGGRKDGEGGAVVGEGDAGVAGELARSVAPAVDGANQDTAGDAFGFADDVEAVVDAVNEEDIGAARGAKKDFGAGRAATKGVGGAVAFGQIGLGFGDDAFVGAEPEAAAEEVAGDVDGGLGEEAGRQGGRRHRRWVTLCESITTDAPVHRNRCPVPDAAESGAFA